MFTFRPFRNADPPDIARLWNEQPPQRGLVRHLSPTAFEQTVLSKPYFDREGLIIASRDGQTVGFVHAGFGPSQDERAIDCQLGTTCMVMTSTAEAHSTLAADLLDRSESYLKSHGSQVLYGGAVGQLAPFYLGLYGGSEMPGILASDELRQKIFHEGGYGEIDRVEVLHGRIDAFRPPVNRQQLQLRRTIEVVAEYDPHCPTWWQACTTGSAERLQFHAIAKGDARVLASATFWDLEPLTSGWGVRTAGLIGLEVVEDRRREGIATFLLSEAFRLLAGHGIASIEVQSMAHNRAALSLYEKLGFKVADFGTVLRKEAK